MDFRELEDWKKLLIIIAAASVLAVLLTVIFALAGSSSSAASSRRSSDEAADSSRNTGPVLERIDEFRLTPQRFMFPPVVDEIWYGTYQPLRERKFQWDMEEFTRFYYDPRHIGSENLREQNRELIEGLLEEIP
ncbi:hypothetical protein [Salinispira pacifica]|uniref:Uncharacterized protein n=1 Tax=Salinispira pacifica TaxID=1307761 RepID=V5WHM2_9SPIO|nr:hypothetical protein [Salinispira pacifica]AHC15115.1 hypothetical protein L21SP2_1736 [Salinispira pacifica]